MEFSRTDYMSKQCTHDQYYRQFVTQAVYKLVEQHVTVKAIVNSTDEHFNDIDLRAWDSLFPLINAYLYKNLSMAEAVCIAKAAARQIKKTQKNEK